MDDIERAARAMCALCEDPPEWWRDYAGLAEVAIRALRGGDEQP